MTVGELIDLLKDFDRDAEVIIAEYQRRGCSFAYDVGEIEYGSYDDWEDEDYDYEDGKWCVEIIMGSQIGTMRG